MADNTGIEWTEATWNPCAGCTPVSPGCAHCYAGKMARRLKAMGQSKYVGITTDKGIFNGQIRLDESALTIPLHWKKPRRIFVNSMSDLFHEKVPFDFVDRVFAVMALCPQHTFQVLTKRPERMAEYMQNFYPEGGRLEALLGMCETSDASPFDNATVDDVRRLSEVDVLPNLWLGTSIEDQKRADERIPWLLKCPAAVRFLSCEPLLGQIDLELQHGCQGCNHPGNIMPVWNEHGRCSRCDGSGQEPSEIDWVIVGGESGPGARPCDVQWIRGIVRQCMDAGVKCFVKQLGAAKFWSIYDPVRDACEAAALMKHPKGGDPAEWPADLRVQEMPR